MISKRVWSLTPAKIILGGFFLIILTGGILLSLPIASKSGQSTAFLDSIFTATSATCVTGLIVHDTYTYWSLFGQVIILILIQCGGMGVVTLAIAITVLSGKKIGLKQRFVMQESISAPQVGGIVRMTKFIVQGTIFFELTGAIIMAFQFCPQMGFFKGIWFSVFHSISAFCNAGFDLLGGTSGPFTSLTSYVGNPIISIPIMCLIAIGGIGFFVWDDIKTNRLRFRDYHLQTKIVLVTTFALILIPAILLFIFEFSRDIWNDMPLGDRILASFFQSVTPRTAGFNTVDLASLSTPARILFIILMIIGGSPGSTAGGIKTTTFALAFLCIRSAFQNQDSIQCFKRRIPYDILRNAIAILTMYLTLFLTASFLISWADGVTLTESAFEASSAIATVGLSLGITGDLSAFSKILLISLMYFGRVGGLTMLYALTNHKKFPVMLPQERITVG
ncbi:MAG: TrkH family potassium uptake protein [Clostridium sp.]